MLIFSVLAIAILLFWCYKIVHNYQQSKTKMIDVGIVVFALALIVQLGVDLLQKI